MTYVELIVVLSIFSVMTSVVLFNYGEFQAKVDIKNLASDIALKIVEAQKASLSGLLPPFSEQAQIDTTWKPSYGVYFSTVDDGNVDNKSFIYFVDLLSPDGSGGNIQNGLFDASSCPGSGECLEKVTILKNDSITGIKTCNGSGSTSVCNSIANPLIITFKRPNSGAIFRDSTTMIGPSLTGFEYMQITVASQSSPSTTANINIYPSGRIQVN